MNGCGNQFAILDLRGGARRLTADLARAIAEPASGPISDQVIAIEPPMDAASNAFMRIWNRDGGEVEACGNAARCVAWLLLGETGADAVEIDSKGGLLRAARAGFERVTVDMGAPRLDWRDIPLAEAMDTRRLELEVGPRGAPILHTPGAVNMGNPHCVFFVEDVAAIDIARIGPMLEHHPLFPQRANIGFAQLLSDEAIRLRVWERGAGLTKACGTGACAAVVAGARRGLWGPAMRVIVDGGELEIDWRGGSANPASPGRVFMTGPVEWENTGEID